MPATTAAAHGLAAPGAPLLALNGHDVNGVCAEQQGPHASILAELEELLMHGHRRDALTAAVNAGLFDHALVIASSLDKDIWRDTVEKFISHGLTGQAVSTSDVRDPPRAGLIDSRRSSAANSAAGAATVRLSPNLRLSQAELQVTYSHLAGQNPAWVEDFFAHQCIGEDSHAIWPAAAALILSSGPSNDSATLLAMGDGLRAQGRFIAAQFLYLLAPPQVVFGNTEPGARITLIGADRPMQDFCFRRNVDHIYLTEIVEFALSLAPAPKGTEQFTGLPHLQAYKLLHAYQLAEAGETTAASKYCEAISTAIKAAAPTKPILPGAPAPGKGYYNLTLLQQLKDAEMLFAPGPQGKSSWTTKIQRPTMDGMGGALEGFLTKFIAGDDTPPPTSSDNTAPKEEAEVVGPFSHFSAITPAAVGAPERAPSVVSLRAPSPYQRSPSALSVQHPQYGTNGLLTPRGAASRQLVGTRPSMSVDTGDTPLHTAGPSRAASPGPYAPHGNGAAPPSAGPYASGAGEQTDPYAPSVQAADHYAPESQVDNPYAPGSQIDDRFAYGAQGEHLPEAQAEFEPEVRTGYAADDQGDNALDGQVDANTVGPESHVMENDVTVVPAQRAETPQQHTRAPSSTDQEEFSSAEEPPSTAASHEHSNVPMYGEGTGPDSDGFLAMADVPDFGIAPEPETGYEPQSEEEDDDLGLGNASGVKPEEKNEKAEQNKKEAEAKAREAEEKAKAGGGWLSRLFAKKQNQTDDGKPVYKAHLGEKTTMYYDKELKRWVKPGQEAPAAASATPPPPRGSSKAGPQSAPTTRAGTPAGTPSDQAAATAATPPSGPPRATSSLAERDDHAALQPPRAAPPAGLAAKSAPASTIGSGPPSSAATPKPVGGETPTPRRAGPDEPTPGPPRASRNKKKPLNRRYVPLG